MKMNLYVSDGTKIASLIKKDKKDFRLENIHKEYVSLLKFCGLSAKNNVFDYFDNLLPEESERQYYCKINNLAYDDVWSLLKIYGYESIGAFIISEKFHQPSNIKKHISKNELQQKIKNHSLQNDFMLHNKMSVAGAQNKILINYEAGDFYLPSLGSPTSHILKPESQGYPFATVNEYFVMKLAQAMELSVPDVFLEFLPDPVYIIKRFDRQNSQRIPLIDAVQMLSLSKELKYEKATISNLRKLILMCDGYKPDIAHEIGKWVVFNYFIGNTDNHLKNLSFFVDNNGYHLAPHYDLLSTAIYSAPLFQSENQIDVHQWQQSLMTIELNGCRFLSDVTYHDLYQSLRQLGVGHKKVIGCLQFFEDNLLQKSATLIDDLKSEIKHPFALKMINSIHHVIIHSQMNQIIKSKKFFDFQNKDKPRNKVTY